MIEFILKLNKTDKEKFEAKRTLEDGASNARSSQSRMEQEQKDMETLLSTFTESIGN